MSSLSKPATSDNLRAGLFMLASMAGFVVNDTFVKLASADLSTPEIMAVRGAMATLLLFALAKARGASCPIPVLLHPTVLLRAGADVAATVTYILALAKLPIATASAVFQALPLAITIGAALFLGQRVGWRRWLAIAVGFGGVMIIVRPGAGTFSIYSLGILASVVFSAARDLVTRRMPASVPSVLVSAVTALAVAVTGCLLLPFWQWTPLQPRHYGFLAGAAVAIAFGYICIVEAMRVGDMGFVAPLRYSILVYALVAGFVVFGDPPDAFMLLGAAIVVASGGYSLLRERASLPLTQAH